MAGKSKLDTSRLPALWAEHGGHVLSVAQALGCGEMTVYRHAKRMGLYHPGKALQEPPEVHAKRERERERAVAQLHAAATKADVPPPRWLVEVPKTKGFRKRATVVAFLSDTHFDEVVDLEELMGSNKYDRRIGEMRLRRFTDRVVQLSYVWAVNREHVEIDQLVLMLGGDILSGYIHDELRQTNEGTVLEGALFWAARLVACIEALLEHFPRIYVPCVVGNHGRLDRKPRAKGRVHENYDWLVYQVVAQHFVNEKRVEFSIPISADCWFSVYDYSILLTHGDQFRGGTGISGHLMVLARGMHKKLRVYTDLGKPFSLMACGHWHQYTSAMGILCNGSLKGYDEYAMTNSFGFEPPQQAFMLIAPGHGITLSAPVHASNREEEGW